MKKLLLLIIFISLIFPNLLSQNKYVSQFVPLPLDFLQRQANRRQSDYDSNLKYVDQLIDAIFDLKKKTNDAQFLRKMDELYKKLRSFDGKDFSRLGSAIRKVSLEIKEEIDRYNQRIKKNTQNNSAYSSQENNKYDQRINNSTHINTEYSGQMVVVNTHAPLRDLGSIDVITIIPKGKKVMIISQESEIYYHVVYNGIRGRLAKNWINFGNNYSKEKSNATSSKANSNSNNESLLIDYCESSRKKIDSGDIDGAYIDIEKALKKNPNHIEAYFLRGYLNSYYSKNYDSAINDFLKVTQMSPQMSDGYFNLGIAYSQKNDDINAIKHFSKCIQLNPNNTDALFYRGWRKSKLGDNYGAIKDYDKILSLINEHPLKMNDESMVYNNRGYAKCELKKYQEALSDVNNSLRLNKKNYYAWGSRGEINYHLGNYLKCVSDLNRSLSLNPNDPISLYFRGMAKLRLDNNNNKAYKDLSKAGELGYAEAYEAIKKYFK